MIALGRNPIWSVDGTKVIYESEDQNIWMVDADGTNAVNLTADLGVE